MLDKAREHGSSYHERGSSYHEHGSSYHEHGSNYYVQQAHIKIICLKTDNIMIKIEYNLINLAFIKCSSGRLTPEICMHDQICHLFTFSNTMYEDILPPRNL